MEQIYQEYAQASSRADALIGDARVAGSTEEEYFSEQDLPVPATPCASSDGFGPGVDEDEDDDDEEDTEEAVIYILESN